MLIPASQKSFCVHAEPQIFPSLLTHIPHPHPQELKRGELFPFGATSGQQNILNGLPNSRFSQEIDAVGSRYNISA